MLNIFWVVFSVELETAGAFGMNRQLPPLPKNPAHRICVGHASQDVAAERAVGRAIWGVAEFCHPLENGPPTKLGTDLAQNWCSTTHSNTVIHTKIIQNKVIHLIRTTTQSYRSTNQQGLLESHMKVDVQESIICCCKRTKNRTSSLRFAASTGEVSCVT